MTEMLYMLICEGSCNPSIGDVDEMLRRYSQRAQNGHRLPPIGSEYLWERQRQLKYTRHVETGGHYCRCTVCHAVRRFGN